MFSREYYFKYSDLDSDGNIKISTIIDLLQDVSISHSAAVGYTLEKMQEISLAMLLFGWRIKLYKPLKYDSPATLKTGIMKIQRCDVLRKYEILQDGEVKGIATADWFSFNTQKRTIIRVPSEINSKYDTVNEADNNFPLVRLRPYADGENVAQIYVAKHDLDTNGHMNNVKSAEVALDYIPCDIKISELQIVYVKELIKGNMINVLVKDDDDGYTVELCDEDKNTCVIVKAIK